MLDQVGPSEARVGGFRNQLCTSGRRYSYRLDRRQSAVVVMNLQIKPKKKKKESKVIKAPKNVFAGDEDDSDQEDTMTETSQPSTSLTQQHRAAVNRSIAQEQNSLYQLQEKTAVEYDFDGTYNESRPAQAPATINTKEDDKKSRYIGDLLKAAERRKRTHDLVYERNVAREQAQEEEMNPELRGKDRFITSSYKQKLQEQKQWKAKEMEEERQEEQNDVTKRGTMAHFYGNFSKNVAVGGTNVERSPSPNAERPSFLDGFAKNEDEDSPPSENIVKQTSEDNIADDDSKPPDASSEQETTEQRRLRQRKDREARVASARERYFLRHPSLPTD